MAARAPVAGTEQGGSKEKTVKMKIRVSLIIIHNNIILSCRAYLPTEVYVSRDLALHIHPTHDAVYLAAVTIAEGAFREFAFCT